MNDQLNYIERWYLHYPADPLRMKNFKTKQNLITNPFSYLRREKSATSLIEVPIMIAIDIVIKQIFGVSRISVFIY